MLKKYSLIFILLVCHATYAQNDATNTEVEQDTTTTEEASKVDSTETPEAADGSNSQTSEDTTTTENTEKDSSSFSGEGELGYTTTDGNTDTKNLNGKLSLAYQSGAWTHSSSYKTQSATDSDVITVERSIAAWKTDYSYSPRRYALAAARYEDDGFSGFAYQRSFTLGHGWHIADTERSKFDVELGYGYKQSKTDLAEEIDEGVARLFINLTHGLSKTTQFTQKILVEAGEENTHSESSTGLKVSINSNLALKISYDVKHNSDPPPNIENTDKATSMTLVYGF